MFSDLINSELEQRWAKLQANIVRGGAAGMLVSSNVNIFYLAGRVFNGAVYVPAQGEPLFFVRRPVGLEGQGVVYIRKIEDVAQYFVDNYGGIPAELMVELDSISYTEFQRYSKAFIGAKIVNGTPSIRAARSIKTEYEIEQIRISAQRQTEVYAKVPSLYREGMTDCELSIEVEREMRLNGSIGMFRIFGQSMEIFMGSLLAGDNATTASPYDFALGGAGINSSIPVGCNGTKLASGMAVMVDMGANYTGYMADMTRVFSVGKLSDIAYRAHQTSRDIESAIAKVALPGVEAKMIYELALAIASEAGLGEYFMGFSQKAGFVGHGVGIEINEAPVFAPRSGDVLAESMVFAFEPKFVLPGIGAVGVENTYVQRKDGIEKLSVCEEEIIEI